jgi:hypothetical protein
MIGHRKGRNERKEGGGEGERRVTVGRRNGRMES